MKYTESCHLPQWEKSDRVMMEDFNRMCGDIDRELESAKRTRQKLEQLTRDSYRQEVRSRVHHGRGGETDAMWVNALATREDAGGDGHGWNGRYGVSFGPSTVPTLDGCAATAKEEAVIFTVSSRNDRRAAVTFTSDGYGMLKEVCVWSYYHPNSSRNEYNFTITMTRLDTDTVVGTAGPFLSESSNGSYYPTQREVNFPVESGVSYRLEFCVPEGHSFSGEAGFALASSQGIMVHQNTALIFEERAGILSNSYSLTAPECAQAADGIIRWRGEGSVKLLINGTLLQVAAVQQTINAIGESCWETIFTVDSLPDGEFTLTMEMEITNSDEDFSVFDYGLIWK